MFGLISDMPHLIVLLDWFVGVFALLMGLFVLIREGFKQVSLCYLILSFSFGFWLISFGFMNNAHTADKALFWANLSHLATPMIAASAYFFVTAMLNITRKRLIIVTLGVTLAVLFIMLQQFFGFMFNDLHRFDFGYYPAYSSYSPIYLVFFFSYLLLAVYELIVVLRAHEYKSQRFYHRTKLFLIAYLIGYLASIDFIGFYGYEVPPIGVVPILFYFAINSYAVMRYRLLDITPQFAVNKIMDTMADPLLVLDNRYRIKFYNHAAIKLFGYNDPQFDYTIDKFIKLNSREDWYQFKTIFQDSTQSRELNLKHKNGDKIECDVSVAPLYDRLMDELIGYVMVAKDIRKYKEAQRQLTYLAEHDYLTGLKNRRGYYNQLTRVIEAKEVSTIAFYWLDINQFKLVNDSLGHHYGDRLLQAFSHYLTNNMDLDLIARIGGDEFALINYDIDNRRAQNKAYALINELKKHPFQIDSQTYILNVSIGIAFYPEHSQDLDGLMVRANTALQAAKHGSNGDCHIHSMVDEQAMALEIKRYKQVKNALANRQLQLWGQPIHDIEKDKTYCYELLLRMPDEDGSILTPADFLHAAETYGLMSDINRYVIVEGLKILQKINEQDDTVCVSVNIGGKAIVDDAFLEFLKQTVHNCPADPEQLIIEMTETAIITNLQKARHFIQQCRQLGVRVAMDDFGVGISSLHQIKKLPVDIIKIDGSFVRNVCHSEPDYLTVNYIAQLANHIKIRTIAEFVEDQATLQMLRRLQVNCAQGFYLGRPAPVVDQS